MDSTTEMALTITFIGLGFVHALISSTWFLRRRHVFPISGRDTALVMMVVVSSLVTTTLGGISRSIVRQQCGWVAYLDTIFGSFPLVAWAANGCRIWLKYNIARDKMKGTRGAFSNDVFSFEQMEKSESSDKVHLAQSNELEATPSSSKEASVAAPGVASQSWYIRHEHWTKSCTLLTWTLGFSTVASIALVALYVAALLSPNPPDPTDAGCEVKSEARNFVFAFSGVCFLFFVLTVRQLRGIEDGFGLKYENKIVCASFIVVVPIIWLFGSSGLPFYSYVARVAYMQFMYVYLLDVPLWRSYYSPLAKRTGTKLSCTSRSRFILTVLHDPEYAADVQSFKAHLVKEFSSESLLFYYEAQRFEDVASGASLEAAAEIDPSGESQSSNQVDTVQSPEKSINDHQRMIANYAMTIYCEYIDANALSQLNIDDTVTGTITQKLRAAITNFDEIRESIPKKSVFGVLNKKLPASEYLDDERTASMVVRNCVVRGRVDPNVFCEAKEKVLNLLEFDPFIRWRRAKEAVDV